MHIEEALQEVELQHPREDNGAALSHRPPVDIVVVGLQEEGVRCFPHPGKVVEPPHVEDVGLQFLGADLWKRQVLSSWAAAEPGAGRAALGAPLVLSINLKLQLSQQQTALLVPSGGPAHPCSTGALWSPSHSLQLPPGCHSALSALLAASCLVQRLRSRHRS